METEHTSGAAIAAPEKLVIQLDFSKSDLGDWDLIVRSGKFIKTEDFPQWVEFLDRVLVGGKKSFPMTSLREVIRAVYDQLSEQANPKAPAAQP